MEINKLLQNTTVKNILTQAGIPQEKMQNITMQAVGVIQEKFHEHPSQMSSLLSGHPLSERDNMMEEEMECEFVQILIEKDEIPEYVANTIKEILPVLIEQLNGSISHF